MPPASGRASPIASTHAETQADTPVNTAIGNNAGTAIGTIKTPPRHTRQGGVLVFEHSVSQGYVALTIPLY